MAIITMKLRRGAWPGYVFEEKLCRHGEKSTAAIVCEHIIETMNAGRDDVHRNHPTRVAISISQKRDFEVLAEAHGCTVTWEKSS
jgi:hypothetical protein